ncbi:hypothetical protein N7532_004651 [Penicillium argentinense]|uniref:BTB domain-containing protein n=1 Tax=Penicillium argentinense TaxID=1131581 RepID=A0A9W9FQB6_9EURO|nr:uncharacterized protein N7532_004651 [Penicillium argentinense]KAJ5104122.1 hypothetical protein N7532_004651 [Penicillium argentinense]
MVSSAQILDRTAPNQSTQSVVSRHSHSSRRHRSGRSNHGGRSLHTSSNDFPIFTYTGDTEIVIRAGAQEKRYLLHRLILAQCSGFFEASTNEDWSRQNITPPKADSALSRVSEEDDLSNGSTVVQSDTGGLPARSGEKRRWQYELDWENRAQDEEPILVQRVSLGPPTVLGQHHANRSQPLFEQYPSYSPMISGNQSAFPPTMTKPSNVQAGFFRSMANLAGMQSVVHLPQSGEDQTTLHPLLRDYDNLFRLFYNHPPNINSVNIASAYTECKSLLALADMYDALPVTGPRVDHHLLGFGSRLFKQIAKYPPSYLKLGYLARSRVIFSEALIHVVGQWPAALPNLRNGSYAPLPDAVLDLIEDKYEDLEDVKARVESKLFRLSLTTSRGERVGPSNAYLDWLAVSLFRQWLIESTTPPPAPILKNSASANAAPPPGHGSQTGSSRPAAPSDPAARVYRLIGSPSSQAYLPHDEIKRFLKLHPISSSGSLYSRETLKRFERKMDEIKRLAREIVKPLMRNFLELETKSNSEQSSSAAGARESTPSSGLPYLTCTRVEEIDLPWK